MRFYILTKAVRIIFDAGNLNLCSTLAQVLLDDAKNYTDDWNHDNAIHYGNVALGRVALREGKFDVATNHLNRSAQIVGSPQISNYGPSFELCAELLEEGADDTVIDYLERCSDFWSAGRNRLNFWIAEIKQGRRPKLNLTDNIPS